MTNRSRMRVAVAAKGSPSFASGERTSPWLRRPAIAALSVTLLALTISGKFTAQTAPQLLTAEPAGQNGSGPSPEKIKIQRNSQDGLLYVWIPPGSFTMGCSTGDDQCFSEEKPAHPVNISKGFWISQTEVTIEAYEKFAGITDDRTASANSALSSTIDQHDGQGMPVVNVTWDEANDFCKWAGGRLPSEAEWEYAARAGSSTSRYAELDDIAWYEKNSGDIIHRVGQKHSNQFGLFDMLGNTWEWVNDWYDGKYYVRSPELDPVGPETGQMHGLRGGSWLNSSKLVRASDRGRSISELRFNYFGLRCVLAANSR
jgi:formylglycine-generating enzyme required for sulfatase activity